MADISSWTESIISLSELKYLHLETRARNKVLYIIRLGITWLWMQFGVNVQQLNYTRLTGLYSFVVFEKFTSAYLHQIAWEIILLIVNNSHEKCITEGQEQQNVFRV